MEVLNHIAGAWRPAASTSAVIDPTSAGTLWTTQVSDGMDVAAAVSAADAAFPNWASRPGPDRGDVVFRAAALVDARAAELADLVSREVGKPIREAHGEVARTAAILRFHAGAARRISGALLPSDAAHHTITLRAPLGPIALITPWNFPLAIPAWKMAPALVAGNTVVLKPAPQAPRCAAELVKILLAAGAPAGGLALVCGDAATGTALLADPRIAAVSFTGSLAAGGAVRVAAANRGIRAQLELGGKNVVTVLADANLPRAARAVAAGAFDFAGQKCTATGLCLVAEAVAEPFLVELRAATAAVRVGPPNNPETNCGPLISAAALDAAIAAGCKRLDGPGFFAAPALVERVDGDDPRASQELFAPLLPIRAVADLDEALAVTNALPTGLAAGLHTGSAASAWRFLHEAAAGVIAVNRPTTGLEAQAPFGGLKASGSEHPEQGGTATDFYTVGKTAYWAS